MDGCSGQAGVPMKSNLGLRRRLAKLLASRDHSSLELVMTANALAGVAVGAILWLAMGVRFACAACLVPVVFLLLTVGLLYRRTLLLSASVGSVVMASAPAIILGLLGGDLFPMGTWLGGIVGFLGGVGITGWTYVRIFRIASGVDHANE